MFLLIGIIKGFDSFFLSELNHFLLQKNPLNYWNRRTDKRDGGNFLNARDYVLSSS